jgi:hypothetical protein
MNAADYIYNTQEEAFRVNISMGLILRDIDQGSYRYFIPAHNSTFFDFPIVISSRRDLQKLRHELQNLDLEKYVRHNRPNTKLQPHFITNINFYVTNIGKF